MAESTTLAPCGSDFKIQFAFLKYTKIHGKGGKQSLQNCTLEKSTIFFVLTTILEKEKKTSVWALLTLLHFLSVPCKLCIYMFLQLCISKCKYFILSYVQKFKNHFNII